MEKTKILLVDDEPDIIRTLEFRLNAAGYEVKTAANGTQALEVMRRMRVNLILADFMMPEMNGIELTRVVKASPLWFDTRVLLFSANPDPEFRRKAIEMGAEDYLPKTLGANVIVERVHELARPELIHPAEESQPAPPAARPEPQAQPERPAPQTSDDENLRSQLASLAHNLKDVLHLADAGVELPGSTSYALASARRIANDISRLAGVSDEQ